MVVLTFKNTSLFRSTCSLSTAKSDVHCLLHFYVLTIDFFILRVFTKIVILGQFPIFEVLFRVFSS